MHTQRLYPAESFAITPPRGARADTRTSPEQLRARCARHDGLPSADVLTEPRIHDALNQHGVPYRDRVFSPVTTPWGFLSQALSEGHSCRQAASRLIAHRVASGPAACSPGTASYCNARGRLPIGVPGTPARRTADELQAGVPEGWEWDGRDVFIADGSHVWMPDAPENRAAYPQPTVREPGIGFPLARAAVLLSLATGACHDPAIAPYAGEGTGEASLPRRMDGSLSPGDVAPADAPFDNSFIARESQRLGVDPVARVQAERVGSRTVEGRPDGAIILWRGPDQPRGMTGEEDRRRPC